MFRTIVVGHDGSARGDAALALAQQLRDPAGGRLVLTAVAHHAHQAREDAMARLTTVARTLPAGVPVELEVLEARSAAGALLAVARARDADLIVLGPSHRGELGRLTGRTLAQRILHAAPCTIAVSGSRSGELRVRPRILVAHDGSVSSEAALDGAYELAEATFGSITLCRVLEPVMATTSHGAFAESLSSVAERDHDARDALEVAAGRAPAGVAVEVRVLRGVTADRLLEETLSADAVVLGSRHRDPLRRAVAGSVSTQLLTRSDLPVLVWASPHVDPVDVPMRAGRRSGTLSS